MGRQAKTALILAGGGARGAYEAGFVRYLRTELAADLGFQPRIDILCGTSVGAINACFLAAWAHRPERQVDLCEIWGNLDIRDVFELSAAQLLRVPRWLVGRQDGRMSLLNAEPLERLVTRNTPWARIHDNVESGVLTALTVTATRIADGAVVVFTERHGGGVPSYAAAARTIGVPARIGPRHALASAAIPIVFPAVPVRGFLYCDGGLRQNTPLLPALALGAERVLVVGARAWTSATLLGQAAREATEEATEEPAEESTPPGGPRHGTLGYPSAPFLFGKVLNALLIDQIEHDLTRLRQLNALLDEAEDRFGPDFVDRLAQLRSPLFGTPFRRVREFSIAPSVDVGVLVKDHIEAAARQAGRLAARVLRALAPDNDDDEDLASYLMFYGPYARALMDLAYEDARAQHDALISFFAD